MSRVSVLPLESWTAELRDAFAAEPRTPVERDVAGIMARAPRTYRAFLRLGNAAARESGLPPRLFELLRLRVAFFNQCRSCMAIRYEHGIEDGVTEGLVCSLEHPEEAPDLTPAEQAALRYAELMAVDHLAIDDAVYENLRIHFTEDEIVSLGMWLAMSVGFGRLAATWKVTDHLPDRFRGDGVVTPWGDDAIVVR